MDVLTWGMTCPPTLHCLTAAPCPCADACAALLSASLGKASVSKAGHKNHPAFRWSSFSPARALGGQGKGKQQVHNRAPGMPNAGLEPLCKQTEMQTQSTSPAALPALGAGLDKAGMAQPGSLAVRGISCWQRAATVAAAGEGREATRQQRSGGFVLRLQDCLKSPTSANISTAELLDNSAGGAPGNTQPEQNNFEGNYMSWDLVLSLSLVEEIIWPI